MEQHKNLSNVVEKKLNEIQNKAKERERIRQEYETICQFLQGKPELELVKSKLSGLYEKFGQAVRKEQSLKESCKQLNKELISNMIKIQGNIKYREGSVLEFKTLQQNTQNYFKNIKTIKQKKEELHEKTAEIDAKINELGSHFAENINQVEQEAQKSLELNNQKKEKLQQETLALQTQYQKLLEAHQGELREIMQEEKKQKSLTQQNKELKEQIKENQDKIQVFEQQRLKVQEEIEAQNENKEKENKKFQNMKKTLKLKQNEIKQIQEQTKLIIQRKEKLKDQNYKESHEIATRQKEIKHIKMLNNNYLEQIARMEEDLTDRQTQLEELEKRQAKELKRQEVMNKMLKNIKIDFRKALKSQELLQDKLKRKRQQVADLQDMYQNRQTVLQEEQRRKDELGKILQRKKNSVFNFKNEILSLERSIKKYENKISGTKSIIAGLQKRIDDIIAQQDAYSTQNSNAHARFFAASEDLKVKNYVILNLQNKNKNLLKKLKQQKSLYIAVRNDRNVYSKSLLDVKEEIGGLNKNYIALSHQIKQIKEEIKFKANEIAKALKNHDFIIHENQESKSKKNILQKQIAKIEKHIHFYQKEVTDLKILITEANVEKKKKLNAQEGIISERDLLSIQLLKRQEELVKVIMNLKSIQNDIDTDDSYFQEKKDQLQQCQIDLDEVTQQNLKLKEELKNYHPLKMEVLTMQKEILKLQTRISALKNQLSIPINIHRWRKIEATNPEKYNKILKIQEIQKRIIEKNEEVKAQEEEISKKEKELFEYKNIIARHAYNNTDE